MAWFRLVSVGSGRPCHRSSRFDHDRDCFGSFTAVWKALGELPINYPWVEIVVIVEYTSEVKMNLSLKCINITVWRTKIYKRHENGRRKVVIF